MSVYVVAQLKFTNEPRYRIYQRRFAAVFTQFNGKLLSADEGPKVMEGIWETDKIVMMEFENEVEAETFLRSPEYLEISKDREAGAETMSLLARGL